MAAPVRPANDALALSPRLTLLPIRHGSGEVAQVVRDYLLHHRVDCLALPLPPSVEPLLEGAVEQLPLVHAVVLPNEGNDQGPAYTYVPVDPCQPVVMGLRVAMAEGIPRAYIDREVAGYERNVTPGPDPYALKHVSLEAYSAAVLPSIPPPQPGTQRWENIAWMAFRLHELELYHETILYLCPMADWPWVRECYRRRARYASPETLPGLPALYRVAPESLYFILGELPFVTERYEQRRQEARDDARVSIHGIKELLLEARTYWLHTWGGGAARETNWITPHLLQLLLQYVRNVSLLTRRLTPDLHTLVVAAQQFAGDGFALAVLETAKRYRFQDADTVSWESSPSMLIGLDQIQLPDGSAAAAHNRLLGQPMTWKTLALRPAPPQRRQQQWAFQWNPAGQCSWPPEDQKIESFMAHAREQAKSLLGSELARSEKFTTSLRDGIDVRETLRHSVLAKSPRREIYVKDIPPARGTLEIIVFLFEVPADPQTFSWQTTWYAEHDEESTICFYSTPFLENMVGPGIGQARYGGSLFLFPPRPIPDIWTDSRLSFATTLEERLVAGACFHSRESHIALVSPMPPTAAWRRIARRYGRKLIPIPLSRFSGQTVHRLRHFHVLNGHDIRSFAARFIRE